MTSHVYSVSGLHAEQKDAGDDGSRRGGWMQVPGEVPFVSNMGVMRV